MQYIFFSLLAKLLYRRMKWHRGLQDGDYCFKQTLTLNMSTL